MSDWFTPRPITGSHVRLVPQTVDHVPGLFAAGGADPEVWRWLSAPMPATEADLAAIVRGALDQQERGLRVVYTIVDGATGRIAGTTSYYEPVPERRKIEIGYTWLGRPWWRTAVNTEAKLLLLAHAFDVLGCVRVMLRTDLRNERSQRAIARLGAVREGVLRKHMQRPDGSWRDSVIFSIVDDEWPAVRERLAAALSPARPS
ncbi:MAG: GNAT family N-acetyltransferase [Mycobacteriales bacterium]